MKKILVAAIALAIGASFTACANTNSPANNGGDTPAASSGSKTVGIAMPTKALERWNRDGEYLKKLFEGAGYKVELKYSDNNNDQQNNDIQSVIADKVDILLVAAIDGEALTQTLGDAKSANIPVIAYDRLIMGTDAVSYYVSFDNYTVGKLQGEFVRDQLDLDNQKGPFNIEFTAGDPADNNATFFFNGAYDALKKYIDDGKLVIPSGKKTFEQVATPSWSTDTALENMQNTLASYYAKGEQLDVALCSNDSTALGVAQAITSDYNGKNTPIVTGQDGDIANLRNIVNGIQTMTVYKNVNNLAISTLELAKAILNGETPDAALTDRFPSKAVFDTNSYNNNVKDVPSYLLDPTIITKDNLQELVDTGLYQWDADHKYLESTASTT